MPSPVEMVEEARGGIPVSAAVSALSVVVAASSLVVALGALLVDVAGLLVVVAVDVEEETSCDVVDAVAGLVVASSPLVASTPSPSEIDSLVPPVEDR